MRITTKSRCFVFRAIVNSLNIFFIFITVTLWNTYYQQKKKTKKVCKVEEPYGS